MNECVASHVRWVRHAEGLGCCAGGSAPSPTSSATRRMLQGRPPKNPTLQSSGLHLEAALLVIHVAPVCKCARACYMCTASLVCMPVERFSRTVPDTWRACCRYYSYKWAEILSGACCVRLMPWAHACCAMLSCHSSALTASWKICQHHTSAQSSLGGCCQAGGDSGAWHIACQAPQGLKVRDRAVSNRPSSAVSAASWWRVFTALQVAMSVHQHQPCLTAALGFRV